MELDLNELERLAKESTRTPWTFKPDDEFIAAANPTVVIELTLRLREAEKAADRMREALQAIADMQGRGYYKVHPKETAKDAHLIAVGALANAELNGAGTASD